jgi:hypothetical protein
MTRPTLLVALPLVTLGALAGCEAESELQAPRQAVAYEDVYDDYGQEPVAQANDDARTPPAEAPVSELPSAWSNPEKGALSGLLPGIGKLSDEATTSTQMYLDEWMVSFDLEVQRPDGTFAMLFGSASILEPLVPDTSIPITPDGILGCSGTNGVFDFDEPPTDAVITTTSLPNGSTQVEVAVGFPEMDDLVGIAVFDAP